MSPGHVTDFLPNRNRQATMFGADHLKLGSERSDVRCHCLREQSLVAELLELR